MPALAAVGLHNLTEDDLSQWRAALPSSLKETSKHRTVNDLKAALNEAFAANRRRLPSGLPMTIKFGLRDTAQGRDSGEDLARENQILSDAQIGVLIGATREVDAELGWHGDLFRLVAVLAATGARMSQAVRMRVNDVQFGNSRLMVPTSRKGRGRKSPYTPFAVGGDILEVLRPIVEGRELTDFLLERWRYKQMAGGIQWERDTRGPWLHASELVRPWSAIRVKAKLPTVIPYALLICPLLSGPKSVLDLATKEEWNGEEAQAGRDHRQAA